jgi:alpha-glucosidase
VWLGVDAIWLSPIFRSPMRDFGYDIADHRDVDPTFGTLADLDALIAAAHAHGLRLILDFVPNHTSSDHPWFVASRSSRADPKRGWYIWRDPAPGGGPPNNWRAVFGGQSAWQWDEATGQYYLHMFLPEQPDLDWTNPEVRGAMHDVLRFWFDRGVDGFRIDVINLIAKDPELRDDPVNPDWRPGMHERDRNRYVHSQDGPAMPALLEGLRAVADEYEDRVLIGETYLSLDRLVAYYGTDRPGIHLPFNFQLILLPWEADGIRRWITDYEGALPATAWPNWVLGNHDQPRIASRVGAAQARVAATILLTLRGTPTIYNGDELGLPDQPIPPDRIVDVDGRDPERTPMRWDGSANAGFTSGEPWLPMGTDVATLNVATERDDPRSVLHLNRRLLAERRARPALAAGSWTDVPSPAGTLAYLRSADSAVVAVIANLVGTPASVDLPATRPGDTGRWRVIVSSGLDRDGEIVERPVALRGDEALVLEPVGG